MGSVSACPHLVDALLAEKQHCNEVLPEPNTLCTWYASWTHQARASHDLSASRQPPDYVKQTFATCKELGLQITVKPKIICFPARAWKYQTHTQCTAMHFYFGPPCLQLFQPKAQITSTFEFTFKLSVRERVFRSSAVRARLACSCSTEGETPYCPCSSLHCSVTILSQQEAVEVEQ
jgi:hypothetical protein